MKAVAFAMPTGVVPRAAREEWLALGVLEVAPGATRLARAVAWPARAVAAVEAPPWMRMCLPATRRRPPVPVVLVMRAMRVWPASTGCAWWRASSVRSVGAGGSASTASASWDAMRWSPVPKGILVVPLVFATWTRAIPSAATSILVQGVCSASEVSVRGDVSRMTSVHRTRYAMVRRERASRIRSLRVLVRRIRAFAM
jgi:hypothetical protein